MKTPSTPAPSRREANRHSRREAILDVAARSFLEQGYAGTTMSAIAATLGGSKGTLWSYFDSKEVLFGAVIERVTNAFRAQLSLILNPSDGVESALRRFCTEFLRKVTSPEAIAIHRLVMGEAGRFPEVGEIFHTRAPLQTQTLLADFLEGAMARGELRREEPLMAARQLTALCLYGGHQQMLMGLIEKMTPEAIATEVERAAATFMRAYAPEVPS
ncbi:TetR/AcrR family transcriptional regulator [Novosphingobium sp. PS1R-30]|uniref:TetR/AcrR family transcriptional regulator n=1 Tax=Novosphingobium anseongense TaxID=3133436 RepID=A0ABU8RYC0_9SPHN